MKAHLFASVSAQALLASGGGAGNLPTDTAHRYWRVRVIRWVANASYQGLSDLQVYVAGTNVGPQATLTADRTTQAGSVAEILNYVAGSTLCQFNINQGDIVNFVLDFGATPRKVDAIGMYPNKDEAGRSPQAYWIEWSDDNVTWTPKAFCRLEQGEGWTAGTEKLFTIPTLRPEASIWAIWGWMPSGSMGELRMMRSGSDLTTGQTAFSSGQYSSGEDAAKAIDDNDNTNWSGADESNGSTLLGVQFATAVQPTSVEIQTRNDGTYWNQTPWQNIWLGYGDDRRTYRVKTELTAGQTSTPYNGPVQTKAYSTSLWTSGPGPRAARYWRIRGLTQGSGDNTQYSEVEFREVIGGPTRTFGGTAIASAWYDQPNGTVWIPANAFDGNPATNWANAGTVGWIGYDFGSKVEINEVALRQSSGADQYWSSMVLERSNNGTDWTLDGYLLNAPKVDGWRVYSEILRPGTPDEGWDQPHRYWRYVTLQWPTSYQGVNEIRLMNGVTDLIATNGGSASADAAQGGYGPERAFDNNTATGWADNATGNSHWLQWDFGSGNAFAVTDYKLTAWNGLMPTGWKIQFSDDGANWKNADTRLGQDPWVGEETRGFLLGPVAAPLQGYTGLGFDIKGAWATRRIVDGYTGPLLRVRDTTTNVESDLGFGPDGKLVAVSGAPPAVVKVYDQSGNGADIGQTVAAKQPLLIYDATKGGFAAIRFDGNDDYLFDPVAAVDRPYMVPRIVSNQIIARAAGTEMYGSGIHIPHQGGANNSPYKRWGWNWSSDGAFLDYRNNGNSQFEQPGNESGRFPFMNANGGRGALQTWDNVVRLTGLPGANINTNTSDNTYPNPSGIYIGSNGAGDESFAFDFVELVMGAPASGGTAAAFYEACDKIAAATIFEDYEVQVVTVKTPGTAGNIGVSAAEIQMLTASEIDVSTAAQVYGLWRYSGSESWQMAFDDNPNTLWSANGQTWPLLTLLLNASAPKELPTHGTLTVRNDSYVSAGSVKTMYWSALTKDGWKVSNDIVLPDGPTAGQQYSFTVSYP